MSSIMQKKERRDIIKTLEPIPHEKLAAEMEDLMTYYGANSSQANLEKTRKILNRIDISKELSEMRDEK